MARETYGNWLRGADGTGNLTKPANFETLLKELGTSFKANLITADGSFDIQHDPEHQQELLFPLFLSEWVDTFSNVLLRILLALGALQVGGAFVIKMYTMTSAPAVGLIALIANSFKEMYLTKPFLSKPGNSEIYVVCLGFKGISSTVFEACRPRE